MRNLLAAAAALAMMAAPALAQSSETAVVQAPVTGDVAIQAMPSDATGDNIDINATGSVAADGTGIYAAPDDVAGGSASQILTDQNRGDSAAQSTPSDGVVPGQEPE